MGLYLTIQALVVSASTKAFAYSLTSDGALLKHEREFSSARRDGGDCPRAVAVIAICHLVGFCSLLVLTLGELRRDGLLSDLDLERALISFGNDHCIGSLFDQLVADLAVEVERNFLLDILLGPGSDAESQSRNQSQRNHPDFFPRIFNHKLPPSNAIWVLPTN